MARQHDDDEIWTEEMKISDLLVDESYQRPLVRIREPYDERLMRPIEVGWRRRKKHYTMDGVRRCDLLTRNCIETVTCNVRVTSGPQEEAKLFLGFNNSKNQSSLDKFRAALVAREPDVVKLVKAVEKVGLTIALKTGRRITYGELRAHGTLLRIFKEDPEIFGETMQLITDSFYGQDDAMREQVIGGTFLWIKKIDSDYDYDRATRVFRQKGVTAIIHLGNSLRSAGYDRYKGIAEALTTVYNKGLKLNRIQI